MVVQENTIKITGTFSPDRSHRYALKRIWSDDDTRPMACVIMSNAPESDDITRGCLTSMLIQNQLSALQYRGCICVNLFSFCCQKLDLSGDITGLTDDTNMEQILQAVQETDITIIAIGSLTRTYKKAALYENRLFERLRELTDCQAKIHTIAAPDGSEGLHPLSAKLREVGTWTLVPFKLTEPPLPLPQDEKTSLNGFKGVPASGKGKRAAKNEKNVIPLAQ